MLSQFLTLLFGVGSLFVLVGALDPAKVNAATANFWTAGILAAIALIVWVNRPSKKKLLADKATVIEFSVRPSDTKLLKAQLKLGVMGLVFDYDKFLNVLDQDEMLGVSGTGIYNTKQAVIVVTSKRLLLVPAVKQEAWFTHAVPLEDILATSIPKIATGWMSLKVDAESISVLVEKIDKENAKKIKAAIDKNLTKPSVEIVTTFTSNVSGSAVSTPVASAPIANNQPSVKCPKCGAFSLTANKQGYGWKKGVAGGLLTGGLGLLVGFAGSSKVWVTCMNCGHKWQAGKK